MERTADVEGSSSRDSDPSPSFCLIESPTNPKLVTPLPFVGETIHSSRPDETKDSTMSVPETSMLDISMSLGYEPDQYEELDSTAVAEHLNEVELNRGLIDTAAPFESVREAVSKFGSIVDWKAQKAVILERRKNAEVELEKVQEEIPEYKSKLEAAEGAKAEALKGLDGTKRHMDELKLSLEKAETQETQAKQDSELAELRFEEIKKGITNKESFAAKAQLAVAKERHLKAVSDLVSVREEIESLRSEFISLINARDVAMRKAEEAINQSVEIEKDAEDLTLELIAMKELLDSAHSEHLEVEEHRINYALDWDQEKNTWESELRKAEGEMQQLNEQLLSTNDRKSRFETASALLRNLKTELASYVERKAYKELVIADEEKPTNESGRMSTREKLMLAQNELKEVKAKTERSKSRINHLSAVASALRDDIESENVADGFRSGVTLPLEYCHTLCKKAREAEEICSGRVISAIEQVKAAKKSESEIKEKLWEANMKIEGMKKTVRTASDKAEKAKEGKLALETELRQRRDEYEPQSKAGAALVSERDKMRPVSRGGTVPGVNFPTGSARANLERNDAENATNFAEMRGRSFFPQVVVFLARKKAQSLR